MSLPPGRRDTVFVPLANDPASLRPVIAERLADGTWQILSRNDDPESEPWAFSPGSIVHCETRRYPFGPCLLAVGIARQGLLQAVPKAARP